MEGNEEAMDFLPRIYELGYLLVPTLAEERIGEAVTALKNGIAAKNGAFISEEFPKLISLSYPMRKMVAGRYATFRNGYFGWVKFEADAAATEEIKRAAEKNEHVLRFLLIKTVRESTLAPLKAFSRERERVAPRKDAKPAEKPVLSEAEKVEIDKKIEALVVE